MEALYYSLQAPVTDTNGSKIADKRFPFHQRPIIPHFATLLPPPSLTTEWRAKSVIHHHKSPSSKRHDPDHPAHRNTSGRAADAALTPSMPWLIVLWKHY